MGSLSSKISSSSSSSSTINFQRVNRLSWLNLILLLVTLFTISNESLGEASRCRLGICQRSEFDMKCRRCRFREPLRFGKRANSMTQNRFKVNQNDDDHLEDNQQQINLPIKDFISKRRNSISPSSLSPSHNNLISKTTNYHPSPSSESPSNVITNQQESKQSNQALLQYLFTGLINNNQPIPMDLIEQLKEQNLISNNDSYDIDNSG